MKEGGRQGGAAGIDRHYNDSLVLQLGYTRTIWFTILPVLFLYLPPLFLSLKKGREGRLEGGGKVDGREEGR